ncbi:MAG: hypothetical protein OXK76_13025 [Gammaproteobacteria bacterium]|nr:hypothetical protein [Gammaproteobacteria bacterium]
MDSAHRRHLLLDTRVVEDAHNAELALGTVEKHAGNPLFGEDKPWEMRFDNLYANVIYDDEERLYKCWYSPFIVDHSSMGMSLQQRQAARYRAPGDREMAICYATSVDGLTWVKPELGLVEYEGSRANNILWRGGGDTRKLRAGPHGAGVLKDLRDPDPARRYKAFLKSEILSVAFSADGVHWASPIACPEANSAGDTHNNAFWAPTLGRYVGITRQWGKPFGRQVARTSSVDFLDWESTRIALEGLDPNHQTYAMPAFYHGGVYIGLVAIHDQNADRVWTELTWSPDTSTWHRVLPGTPFITNGGEAGDYDWGCVYPAACPVFLDNEVRLYYGASDGLHTSWRNGYLCLATLRADGFAGYKASDATVLATLTTTPVHWEAGTLRVSADIAPGGEVVVRVLGPDRQVLAASRPMASTVSDGIVEWLDHRAPIATETKCRLEFTFRKATVYSFSMEAPVAGP